MTIKNKEKVKEYNAKYWANHKEEIAIKRKKFYQEHKEEIAERNKRWFQNNREKWNAYLKEHRAKAKLDKQKKA